MVLKIRRRGALLRWGSNPMRGSCQLLTEGFWFTPRNNLFLQLWKLTAIYNQILLKNGVKHQFTSFHLTWWSGQNLRLSTQLYTCIYITVLQEIKIGLLVRMSCKKDAIPPESQCTFKCLTKEILNLL